MKKHLTAFSLVCIVALPLALMGAASTTNLSMSKQAATVDNPGNGDFAGFRMVVEPSGKTWAVDGAGQASKYLDPDVARQFFADLAAAGPLGELAKRPCAASQPGIEKTAADVNAEVVVTWNGQRSPDFSCVSDARATKLAADVTTIQRALYVQPYRVRTTIGFGGTPGYISISGSSQEHGSAYSVNFGNVGFRNDFASSGISGISNPFASRPTGTSPFVGFPTSSGVHSASPAGTSPFVSLPLSSSVYFAAPQGTSPFSGSPFTASPFSGGPYGSGGGGSSIMSYP